MLAVGRDKSGSIRGFRARRKENPRAIDKARNLPRKRDVVSLDKRKIRGERAGREGRNGRNR
jgi:hypothetical protein